MLTQAEVSGRKYAAEVQVVAPVIDQRGGSALRWLLPSAALRAIFFVALSLLLRLAILGNPLAGHDEQLYLLVADRMLHGAIPYVDVWDRKPIGLFSIYAVARLFGGDGVLNYQIAAALFAAATAAVLARIAERFAGFRGGIGAGTLYLIGLSLFGGGVGRHRSFTRSSSRWPYCWF